MADEAERRSSKRRTGSDEACFAPPVDGEACPYCGNDVQLNSVAGGTYRCVSTKCAKFIMPENVISSHTVRTKWAYA